ncbi:MAG: hypothetical protein ACODAJ_15330, partial [Planctomycetota bacterium]
SRAPMHEWMRRVLPHHFSSPFSARHLELVSLLESTAGRPGHRLAILFPRGFGKSTIVSCGYVLWAMCTRGIFVANVSASDDLAQLQLRTVREELESNEAIAEAYPEHSGKGPTWKSAHLETRGGAAAMAFGANKAIRGIKLGHRRPGLVVCDDVDDDECATSARERDKVWDRVTKGALPCLDKDGSAVVIGTAIHEECTVKRAMANESWDHVTYRAVDQWPSDMSLWREWERSGGRAPVTDDMRAGASVLWPERYPIEWLMERRLQMGDAAFQAEYQNSPYDPARCHFPPEYLDGAPRWDELPPPGERRLTVKALDPSLGRGDRGDYSAICVATLASDGTIYLDFDVRRRPIDQMVEDFVTFRPDADVHVVEGQAFQELLSPLIRPAFRRRGLAGARLHLVHNNKEAPKASRIRGLAPWLAKRVLRFPARGAELAVSQFRYFPHGEHDDAPDACAMAINWIARHR